MTVMGRVIVFSSPCNGLEKFQLFHQPMNSKSFLEDINKRESNLIILRTIIKQFHVVCNFKGMAPQISCGFLLFLKHDLQLLKSPSEIYSSSYKFAISLFIFYISHPQLFLLCQCLTKSFGKHTSGCKIFLLIKGM